MWCMQFRASGLDRSEGPMTELSGERFILFTKTEWNEPPRLRHQLARLLAASGRQVIMAQRPRRFGIETVGTPVEPGVSLFRHRELIHHRIRVSSPVRALDAMWTVPSIHAALRPLSPTPHDVILNFNYEYFFLRDAFPKNPIITVINDDFVSRALPGCRGSLLRAQRETCRSSDAVLTPSVVIADQLRAFSDPHLFLPWASHGQAIQPEGSCRRILLYWGFVDWRVDLDFVHNLAITLQHRMPSLEIWMVGPKNKSLLKHPLFADMKNVRNKESATLDQLPMAEVIGGLIPFKSGVEGCDAIVLPNKALQLLACGLPLLITGMPHFAKESFVFRLDHGSAESMIRQAQAQFDSLQSSIREFVKEHTPEARLRQFLSIVEEARANRSRALARD